MKLPESHPLDAVEQDLLETLRQAGAFRAANQYHNALGGYQHLAWQLGEYRRGLRITSSLVEAGGDYLAGYGFVPLCYEQSLFLLDTGDPVGAEVKLRDLQQYEKEMAALMEEFRIKIADFQSDTDLESQSFDTYVGLMTGDPEIVREVLAERAAKGQTLPASIESDAVAARMRFSHYFTNPDTRWRYIESALQFSLWDALLAQGKLQEAESLAATLMHHETPANAARHPDALGRRAITQFLLGRSQEALQDFEAAAEIAAKGPPTEYGGLAAVWHILALLRIGLLNPARARLRKCDLRAARLQRPLLGANYDLAFAETALLTEEHARAQEHVDHAFAWSIASGHQETYLRAALLKARLCMRRKALPEAQHLLQDAESVSRAGALQIALTDTLVLSGHLVLLQENPDHAAALAAEAERLAAHSAIGYAWGGGNAAHLLALSALRRDDLQHTIEHAENAIRIRRSIGDPRIANSRDLLAQATQKGSEA